ncbi:MAG: hydantoinase/oxoprolinase family protein, partial [Pirellulaceae bacterium]|nr:hydantoinase/oxoprolinase family protein [Pirellulaceae bacterium]
LLIGNQERDHLFELDVRKPKPLFAEAVEVAERIGTDGDVIEQLDEAAALDELRRLRRDGVESIAICLMNSCANSAHETRLGELAAALDFANVSLSHETSALIKLVSRGDTTTVDAYLNPVLADYISRVAKALGPDSDLRLLTSAGGLSAAAEFRGKDCVLSGPAGGVVGFSRVATAAGFSRSLGFDMGGTSTDVARFDGQFERQYETRKAGVRIVAPMMAIETVAAGGGSICQFDGVKLVVGPSSAGADPGPACYGNGGPLTVTDVNLFLGRLPVDLFPFHLDMDAVTNRLSEIRRRVEEQTGDDWSMESLAAGFWRVANANMARAIRSISVARGYDPTDHLLVPFGGAAGQHACSIARDLRIEQVLSHPHAGVLSALGVGLADIVRHATQGVYRPWRDFTSRGIDDILGQVECEARALASCDGADPARTEVRRSIDLRYRGMDTPLTIDEPDNGDFAAAFDAEHQRRFGYLHPDRDLEWVAARAEAIGRSASSLPESHRVGGAAATPDRATRAFFDGQFRDAAIYRRDTLQPGDRLDGPCIVVEDVSTTVVDPGWRGEVLSSGELLLADTAASEGAKASLTATADPVSLEIYNNLFAA